MRRKIGILAVLALLITMEGMTQSYRTPFSRLGLGSRQSSAMPHQLGMGNVGISNGDVRYMNALNPALLPFNGVYTFSAGVVGGSATIRDNDNSEKSSGLNLSHIAMAFPVITNRWTSSLSLQPYTTVAYGYEASTLIAGTTTTQIESIEGSGGINTIAWSNGIRINKNFLVGLKFAYMFGKINEDSGIQLEGDRVNNQYLITEALEDSYSGTMLGAGFVFSKPLNKKVHLNIGTTLDFNTSLKNERLATIQRHIVNSGAIDVDTLFNNPEFTVDLPSELGIGISLVENLKWSAALDIRMQDWSSFKTSEGIDAGMGKGLIIGLGGEITPDAGDISNFLKRVTYRLGVSYEDTPNVILGESVKDLGINFGWSFPVNNISSLDMGFKYGYLGSISKNALKENYFKFQIGLTFNDRSWFIKRKFD